MTSSTPQLGLTLAEAKQLLTIIQQPLLEQQVDTFVVSRSHCEACGAALQVKGDHTRTFRTLFDTFMLSSPRLYHCRCQRRKTTIFRPLTALLTEATAPELLFMEMKWASLVSYGMTIEALKDFLPVDATLDVKTVRNHALKVAERCEAELGEERIANELRLKLGWRVSPRTVRRYLPTPLDRGGHHRVSSQRWRTFVRHHVQAIMACDFCVVVTATFRLLFVFVVMEHAGRKILRVNVTAHPTAAWTLQQLREAVSVDHVYRFLIHDRASIFSQQLDQ